MIRNTILAWYEKQLEKAPSGQHLLTVVNSRLETVSYDMPALDGKASRAASCLKASGCEKGDRVLISMRETIPVWSFFWGALKLGAVPCVLFPGLGPGGLEVRLNAAEACFFVTDADPAKIDGKLSFPETLKKVIVSGHDCETPLFSEWKENDWEPLTQRAEVDPEDDAFIVFTSGTTGTPKPVLHRHGIAEAVVRSMENILHAKQDDVYWCTAHPAWITGTVYGILGPMLCGIPSIQYEGNFHAKRWMPILHHQKVSLWYTAPTALRALMREEHSFFEDFDFTALKQIYSIGEPLGAAVFHWAGEIFSQPVYDTWFQTECGTIRIANQPGQKIIPGWMGKAVGDTIVVIEGEPGQSGSGRLCLKTGFSSMFKAYYKMPDAFSRKTANGLYETGDLASADENGFLHFDGRADDVINTSGHLVGPVEVEQVLNAAPEVEVAAVVAEPDDLCFEVPAAYIVLKKGQEWSRQLETALKVAVNTGVSAYAVPKHFYIVSELPLTPSGKINRRALRKG